MVRPTQVPFRHEAEGFREGEARSEVDTSYEDLASADRAPARRYKVRTELRLPGWAALAFGIGMTVLATIGAATSVTFALLYWSATERVVDVRAGAESQRALNETCRSELALTRGELSRMDRLLNYARSGK